MSEATTLEAQAVEEPRAPLAPDAAVETAVSDVAPPQAQEETYESTDAFVESQLKSLAEAKGTPDSKQPAERTAPLQDPRAQQYIQAYRQDASNAQAALDTLWNQRNQGDISDAVYHDAVKRILNEHHQAGFQKAGFEPALLQQNYEVQSIIEAATRGLSKTAAEKLRTEIAEAKARVETATNPDFYAEVFEKAYAAKYANYTSPADLKKIVERAVEVAERAGFKKAQTVDDSNRANGRVSAGGSGVYIANATENARAFMEDRITREQYAANEAKFAKQKQGA